MKIRNAFIKLISFTMIFVILFSLIPVGTMTVHAYDNDPEEDTEEVVVYAVAKPKPRYEKDPETCTHELFDRNCAIGTCPECGAHLDGDIPNEPPSNSIEITEEDLTPYCQLHGNHSYESVVSKEPTCTEAGEIKYTCVTCGLIYYMTIGMKPHCYDEGVVTKEPTYQTSGIKTYTCVNCGWSYGRYLWPLVCTSHSWDEGKITTEPTYQNDGVKTYTCTNCGKTKAESIPKLSCTSHAWNSGIVTTAPTYQMAGVRTYTCTNCGQTKTESIPKLSCTSHAWNSGIVTTAPTYQMAGVRTYTCTNCGQTKTETIPRLTCTTHAYGKEILTPAGSGVYYYISECTRCGEVHSSIHEHEYKWVTVKPATAEETGTERYLCEECGYYKLEREIPRICVQACTHPYPRNFVETVPATCCTLPRGNVVCKECGEVIVYDWERYRGEYNPDNHTHFTETVRVAPTYKTNGVMRYTCDDCGYYYTESIPKLDCPHAHTNIKDLADGSWKVCKDCGEKIEQVSSIPSTCSHVGTKKTQVLIKAPTSTEWGEAALVCECGKTVSTEQLHPYSEYQVTKPDGSVVTVYGWFDHDAAHEIADLTNAYRLENGLNALKYNESLQSGSDTRALETVASFSHTRPDGTRWTTTVPEWQYGGENLASGQSTTISAMNAWKESESHNRNLLYGLESGQKPFRGISVGVFHRYIFSGGSRPYTPYEYTYWTQQFTFY